MNKYKNTNKVISRSDALKKIGNYGKYAALTAVITYMLLNPKKAQAGGYTQFVILYLFHDSHFHVFLTTK